LARHEMPVEFWHSQIVESHEVVSRWLRAVMKRMANMIMEVSFI
jgi:hypothetical protein